ncbi:MAG: type II toxin-antitoxin system VapC family toxin [Anaerolineae bacterium]|nr:type II toxin-antitoxin system VapC family toxin [Anaerolineae bacterium]
MRAILDTHAFLWFINDDPNLSARAEEFIQNETVVLSIVSVWEIAIKLGVGKLSLVDTRPLKEILVEQIAGANVILAPIGLDEIEVVQTLPMHHKDPFDRMLIALSLVERMPIVSRDDRFDTYGVQRIW